MKMIYTKTWIAAFISIFAITAHAAERDCPFYTVYAGMGMNSNGTFCVTDSPTYTEMEAFNEANLNASKSYTNAVAARTLREANNYTNAVAAQTLREANSYTDIKTQQALQESKNYTDEQVRQLDKRTSGGMAAISALTGIPALNNNKERNVGVALGTYNGETAFAIGGNMRFTDHLVGRLNIGTSLRTGSQKPAAAAGMAWDF